MFCSKCGKETTDGLYYCKSCCSTTINVGKMMTTLKELNGKMWYRFLKVIYILCYLSYFLFTSKLWDESYTYFTNHKTKYFVQCFILMIVYILVMEFTRRCFYYVVIRKVFPKE